MTSEMKELAEKILNGEDNYFKQAAFNADAKRLAEMVLGKVSRPVSGSQPDSGTYTLVVKFSRQLEDDLDCIEGEGVKPDKYKAKTREGKLIEQFCMELQDGYDETGIAGHFQVISGPHYGEDIEWDESKRGADKVAAETATVK